MKVKINFEMFGQKKGDIVNVNTDHNGIPLEKFWRDRLRESELDGWCEIVKEKKESSK